MQGLVAAVVGVRNPPTAIQRAVRATTADRGVCSATIIVGRYAPFRADSFKYRRVSSRHGREEKEAIVTDPQTMVEDVRAWAPLLWKRWEPWCSRPIGVVLSLLAFASTIRFITPFRTHSFALSLGAVVLALMQHAALLTANRAPKRADDSLFRRALGSWSFLVLTALLLLALLLWEMHGGQDFHGAARAMLSRSGGVAAAGLPLLLCLDGYRARRGLGPARRTAIVLLPLVVVVASSIAFFLSDRRTDRPLLTILVVLVGALLALTAALLAALAIHDFTPAPDVAAGSSSDASVADNSAADGSSAPPTRTVDEATNALAESCLLRKRRDVVGPFAPPLPEDAPRPGLALSGGGIRSATICLGVLESLGRSKAGWLAHFDYLSTVSGGGWAGGALTTAAHAWAKRKAGAQSSVTKGAETLGARREDTVLDPHFWDLLVTRVRAGRHYLFRLEENPVQDVLELMLHVLGGMLANALTGFVLGVGLFVGIHHASYNARGVVRHLVCAAVGCAGTSGWLPETLRIAFPGHSAKTMAALNLLPIVAVALSAIAAVLLLALVLSYAVPGTDSRSTRIIQALTPTVRYAAITFALVLFFQGSIHLTVLLLSAVLLLVVFAFAKEIDAKRLLALGAGAVTGQSALLSGDAPRRILQKLTDLWHLPVQRSVLAVHDLIATQHPGYVLILLALLLLLGSVLGVLVDRNRSGLHGFWSERIRRAFLAHDPEDQEDFKADPALGPIAQIACASGTPLHIVTCAVNLPGSSLPTTRAWGTDHFEITPVRIGSTATGYAGSAAYGEGIHFAAAIGVSAAAINSQGGVTIPQALRPLLAVLNLRLGLWIRNPSVVIDPVRFRRVPRLWSLHATAEVLGQNSEKDAMVLLSDGGHHDNLGLISLVRRGASPIVCVDAAADPGWDFSDLGRTLRMLRDEGWTASSSIFEALRPKVPGGSWAERTVASPVWRFYLIKGETKLEVLLVKAALVEDLPLDVRGYASRHLDFPQQTTADQSFDDAQFEAYLVLGRHLGQIVEKRLEDARPRAEASSDTEGGSSHT